MIEEQRLDEILSEVPDLPEPEPDSSWREATEPCDPESEY